MSPRTRIRLAVFDWAGTVIDFGSRAPLEAFLEVFARRGLPITPAEAAGPMGKHKKDHLRDLLELPTVAHHWHEKYGRSWTPDDLEAMYRELTPLQLETVARHTDLTPGLLECVAELRRRGIRIGGTTGYFRAAAERCAAAAQAQGYQPDVNICSDDVPGGRPAPWMLFRCMEATGVYPSSAVVKVGDTLADVGEGRNAGAWCVAVVDSSSEMGCTAAEFAALAEDERRRRRTVIREKFRAAGAHQVIETLAQLPAVIELLETAPA